MERVSVRSFRAPDLAERAIKDLARSRLDTGREVVFQALGARFLEARGDAARIAAVLREDAFHAETGHFTRMNLRVDTRLAERLAGLEPRAVERRLEDATRDAVLRELPRAQGVYLARFEPSARGGLEPVAHVHLSCRASDGGPAPVLTREEARRFVARQVASLPIATGPGTSWNGRFTSRFSSLRTPRFRLGRFQRHHMSPTRGMAGACV